jgi:hypothetical protein
MKYAYKFLIYSFLKYVLNWLHITMEWTSEFRIKL